MMHELSDIEAADLMRIACQLASAGSVLTAWIEEDSDEGEIPSQQCTDAAVGDMHAATHELEVLLMELGGQGRLRLTTPETYAVLNQVSVTPCL